jgi:HSP20 family molecular chaperone IbpA
MLKVAGGTAAGNMATGASLLVSWLILLVSALAGCAARDMSSRSAASLRGEIDRLFERFGSVLVPVAAPSVPHRAGMAQFVQPLDAAIDISEGDRHQRRQSTSAKTIDISEDEKAYEISAELPGIDANDIDMSLSGGMLVLKVQKLQELSFSERTCGSFQGAFDLPASIDRDIVAPAFRTGADGHAAEGGEGSETTEEPTSH